MGFLSHETTIVHRCFTHDFTTGTLLNEASRTGPSHLLGSAVLLAEAQQKCGKDGIEMMVEWLY